MRKAAALVAVVCLMNLSGCWLPPPAHKTALGINAVALTMGGALILTDDSSEGRGEASGPTNETWGNIIVVTAVTLAALTVITWAIYEPPKRSREKALKAPTRPRQLEGASGGLANGDGGAVVPAVAGGRGGFALPASLREPSPAMVTSSGTRGTRDTRGMQW